ncbi:Kelch repeat-containing 3 [Hyphodiscus hymeniophilus]|uniref:Kelch repeat-containing 3 n=1 Tax=Hyphodiscus hymeniophilus TaxID=353542 RepID=A0A9P7AYW2_9HELO|nr:Kelch repeat-containing 3 [Hyphodiscus hymeniophilus]
MAKDKKSKSEGKKAKIAEKKQKQEKKGEKKEKTKTAKANDSDVEDVDLDAVLAEYAKKQEQFLKVTEAPCDPPKARASSTLISSPSNDNELFLFGGEYFNGALATFFNDLYVYQINRDEWRLITSPNTPLPRSGHAWCRGGNAGGIYLFGGEFSSPKQGTFYHYNDFWRFEPSNREWTRIESKGKTPPARSGHRMTYYKNYIVLFGGFQDTSQQTKYLADLWIYDTQNFMWYNPALPLATQKPDARSSFSFLPHESGAVLFGGYSRIKATVIGKQMKGGGQAQRNVLKPMIHQDCFFLRIIQPASDSASNTPPTVRWERRKKPANIPNPPRAGATMAHHKGRGIMFGGVHDVEETEEGIDSEFFNTLFAWNIERNRYFPLTLRKPRAIQKKAHGNDRGGRRGRGQANEEELLRNLAALETGKSLADADDMDIDVPVEAPKEKALLAKEVLLEFPHPRFNAQLTVQDDVLYIYGGTFEKGDREYTFDEMFAIDLGKIDGVKEIFRREPENWLGSDDEDSEDEDESDNEEDDEDEDEEGDVNMPDQKHPHTETTRKSKRKEKVDEASETASVATEASTFDDTPSEDASSPEDNLPQPRPFESRREFFQRTGNDWQEALMTSLRWKGIQPETLSVKEIKTKAFEISEEKWWDSREEITALEDEQEAAGIGEVVTLADRGEAAGGAGRRR